MKLFNTTILLAAALTIFQSTAALPAVAADNFAIGTSQYSKGDYAGAVVSLNKYLKTNPTSYQCHYMLANSYVQLKDLANGKRCYAMALANKPDNEIREHCLQAIERIGIASAPPPVQRPNTGVSKPVESEKAAKEAKEASDDPADSPKAKKVEEDCARIMADAKTRADLIKEEQKAAILQFKDGHSRWYKKNVGDHWERFLDISPEEEAQVAAPFEERIQKLMDDAENRCNSLRKDLK